MKKIFFGVFCLFTVVSVFGIDSFFAGVGNELNGNSYNNMVISVDLTLGLDVNSFFCVAAKSSFHNDLNNVNVIEPRLLLRTYLSTGRVRPFIQTEGGCVIISIYDETHFMISAGLTTGCRFNFSRFIYLEPAFRLGYPYLWGAGVTAGLRFAKEK
ncbi:MAG: hypothetical protein FWD24_07750 [Treponema sp.]|nr:hypothetical protein [Treponema sp.]